jgi:hypothetical protein
MAAEFSSISQKNQSKTRVDAPLFSILKVAFS